MRSKEVRPYEFGLVSLVSVFRELKASISLWQNKCCLAVGVKNNRDPQLFELHIFFVEGKSPFHTTRRPSLF